MGLPVWRNWIKWPKKGVNTVSTTELALSIKIIEDRSSSLKSLCFAYNQENRQPSSRSYNRYSFKVQANTKALFSTIKHCLFIVTEILTDQRIYFTPSGEKKQIWVPYVQGNKQMAYFIYFHFEKKELEIPQRF